MSEIFRKKSLDRVNSPEGLNEYMRVTNPPIWFALICVILFLIGACFWGATAKLETTSKAVAINNGNNIICYINANNIDDVKIGTTVRINKTEYTVTEISQESVIADTVLNEYEMDLANFKNGEPIYPVILSGEPLVESSQADVILEVISPIYFLLSNEN